MRWRVPLLCALALALSTAAQTQTPALTTQNAHELDVQGNQPWTDTGVDLQPGQTVTITANGKLQYMDGNSPGPQGAARGWRDLVRSMPVNSAGRGALIGRWGSDEAAQPFLVGASLQFPVRAAGRLFLGINGPSGDTASGSFHVKIEISGASSVPSASTAVASNSSVTAVNSTSGSSLANSPAGTATSAPTPSDSASPSSSPANATTAADLPADMLAQVPRRIADKDGNPGDMVNFLLIGSEEQVKATFQAAGWVQVDRDTKDAVLQALVASLSKQAYLTMPMSQLYLFGRPQDYGFAHAEPLTVVTTRHHLRIWKSTLTVGGQPLWVGAATHDMGLERDQRNGKLTHHIDPNVDDERDFVGHSLTGSGYVTQHTSVMPPNPIKDEKTATGGSFHSNGEVLVLWLNSN
jgi:LssY-like putative type I secretion system component LssY